MPDRLIRERARKSEKLSALSAEAERLWWRLVTMADDHGRIRDNTVLILAEALPLLSDRISVEAVDGWIDDLVAVKLVKRYRADGVAVLWLIGWERHQDIANPRPSELPDPGQEEQTNGRPRRVFSRARVAPTRALPPIPPIPTTNSISGTSNYSGGTQLLLGIGSADIGREQEGGTGGKAADKPAVYRRRYTKAIPPEHLKAFDDILENGLKDRYWPTTRFFENIVRDFSDIAGLDLEEQAEKMVEWLTTTPKGRSRTDIPRTAERWLLNAAEDAVKRQRLRPGGYNQARNGASTTGQGRPFGMGGPISQEARDTARRMEQESRERGD